MSELNPKYHKNKPHKTVHQLKKNYFCVLGNQYIFKMKNRYDVIIVGAGPAGIFTGVQLNCFKNEKP